MATALLAGLLAAVLAVPQPQGAVTAVAAEVHQQVEMVALEPMALSLVAAGVAVAQHAQAEHLAQVEQAAMAALGYG
jgi:hypothetical protein